MKFEIKIQNKHLLKCELKDELYYKLLERLESLNHIKNNKNLNILSDSYRKEINIILSKIIISSEL